MSKVVIVKQAELGKSPASAKSSSVGEKRVRAASGKLHVVRTLDGQSKTFGEDLSFVFAKNVAKARRENKLVTGAPDRVPGKR